VTDWICHKLATPLQIASLMSTARRLDIISKQTN